MAFSNSTVTVTAIILGSILSMVNFSYDAGLINQLLLSEQYYEYFSLNSTWIGLIVAMLNVGTMVAGPVVGPLMDWLGRRRAIWLSNGLAIIGVILQAAAQNIGMLLVGRVVFGFGLGISGVCGPTLITEATPGHLHARLVQASMLGMPLTGLVVSGAGVGVYRSSTDWGWRGAFLGEAAAPLLSSFFILFAPESPRWLVFKGRTTEAREVLELVHGSSKTAMSIETEYQEIVQTIEFERSTDESWRALIAKPSDRRRFLIAVLTNVFYQTCGSNTLPYFFTLILASVGITDTYTVLYVNVGLTAWAVLSLASGLFITPRIGTKTFFLISTTIITICLVLLAILTALGPDNGRGHGALAVTFIFWWASCACWMILEFTYPVEILRFSLRGKGTALAQLVGYAFQLTLNYTLPLALQHITWRFYAINAAWDAGIVVCIWFLFVETKGKTLEEMDALFDNGVHFRNVEILDAKGLDVAVESKERDSSKEKVSGHISSRPVSNQQV